MKRRICSLLMAVVMVIGMLPMQAFAETVNSPWEWHEPEDPEYQQGYYESPIVNSWADLKTAIATAPDDLNKSETTPSLLIDPVNFTWPAETEGTITNLVIDYNNNTSSDYGTMPAIKISTTSASEGVKWEIPEHINLICYENLESSYSGTIGIVVNGSFELYSDITLEKEGEEFIVNGTLKYMRNKNIIADKVVIAEGGLLTGSNDQIDLRTSPVVVENGGKIDTSMPFFVCDFTVEKGAEVITNYISLQDDAGVSSITIEENTINNHIYVEAYTPATIISEGESVINGDIHVRGAQNVSLSGDIVINGDIAANLSSAESPATVTVEKDANVELHGRIDGYSYYMDLNVKGNLTFCDGKYNDIGISDINFDGGTIRLEPGTRIATNKGSASTMSVTGKGTFYLVADMVDGEWVNKPSVFNVNDVDGPKTYYAEGSEIAFIRNWEDCEHTWSEPVTNEGKEESTCDKCGAVKTTTASGEETGYKFEAWVNSEGGCSVYALDRNDNNALVEAGGYFKVVNGKASAIFEIDNITEGYRIKSVTINGQDYTEGFIRGSFGGIAQSKIESDINIEVKLEKIPENLPVLKDIQLYTDPDFTQPLGENTDITINTDTTIYVKPIFEDGQTYPDYTARGWMEYSLDGEEFAWTSWGGYYDYFPLNSTFYSDFNPIRDSYDFYIVIDPDDLYCTGETVTSLTYHVNGGASAGGSTEMPKAVAPKSVDWHKHFYGKYTAESYFDYKGAISWQVGDMSKDQTFAIDVYKDGDVIWRTTYNWYEFSKREYVSSHDFALSELENHGPGKYWFTVKALGDGTTTADSDVITSEEWTFNKATDKLAAPTGLKWTDTVVANWSEVENAGGYHIQAFYSADNGNATSTDGMTRVANYVIFTGSEGNKTSFDVYNWMSKENRKDGYYYFKVRTITTDATSELSSDWSALSPSYAKGVTVENPIPAVTSVTVNEDGDLLQWTYEEGKTVDPEKINCLRIEVSSDGQNWEIVFEGSPEMTNASIYDIVTMSELPEGTYNKIRMTMVAKEGYEYTEYVQDFNLTLAREDALDKTATATYVRVTEEKYDITINAEKDAFVLLYTQTGPGFEDYYQVSPSVGGYRDTEETVHKNWLVLDETAPNTHYIIYKYDVVRTDDTNISLTMTDLSSWKYVSLGEVDDTIPKVANVTTDEWGNNFQWTYEDNKSVDPEKVNWIRMEVSADGQNWYNIGDIYPTRQSISTTDQVTYKNLPAGKYTKIRMTVDAKEGYEDTVYVQDFNLEIIRKDAENKTSTAEYVKKENGLYDITVKSIPNAFITLFTQSGEGFDGTSQVIPSLGEWREATEKTYTNWQFNMETYPNASYIIYQFEVWRKDNTGNDIQITITDHSGWKKVVASEEPELHKLTAPKNLEWDKFYPWGETTAFDYTGAISWEVADTAYSQECEVIVYKDGKAIESQSWDYDANSTHTKWTIWDFSLSWVEDWGSGEYYFTVQAKGDGKTTSDSDIVTSAKWNFTMPSEKVDIPTGLNWSWPKAKWTEDEDVAGYVIDVYYSKDNANATSVDELTRLYGPVEYYDESGVPGEHELYERHRTEAGYYYFTVYSVSADITRKWHSDTSVLSSAYAYGVECSHQWNNGVVTTEATCGADGVKTFTCTLCEATKTEVIPATGEHNYVGKVTTEATCCEEGVKTFTCSGCNASYTEVIPATNNHTWDTGYAKNDKTHWFPCTNQACTAKKNEAEHSSNNKICDVDSVCECGYVVKKAGQHTFPTEWQKNETHHWKECTVDGCTGRISEEHTPVVDEAVPPTETTEGKTEGSHCEICGYEIVKQETIPALTAQDVRWVVSEISPVYGDFNFTTNQARNFSENGGALTYSSSDESVATVDANGKATIVGAGECEIIATAAAVPGKYIETSASYKFIVKKAPLTIKANDKAIVYGEAPANNGWTATGYKYDDTADVVKGTVAYTYNYEQFGKAGAYEISISGLTADNYEITFEKGALTVNKASAYTITLDNLEQLDKEVTAVTTAIAPQDTTAVIEVEYKLGDVWGTTLPTEAGEYEVRALLVSSVNIETDDAYTTATLVVNRSIVVGDTNIEVNVDGEKAEIVVTPEELDEIIEKTEGEVTVELGGVENVTELEIPGAFVDAVSKSEKTDGLVINTDDSSISMSEAVVDTVAENVKSGDTIAVKLEAIEEIEHEERLTEAQRNALKAIGQDAVVVEVSLIITHADGSEPTELHELGGDVEVTVPYKTTDSNKHIIVTYVSSDGNVSYVFATYDAVNEQVTFKTNHFSNYAIFESGNPSVVVNEGTGNGIYEAGATVTIKADEKSGYTFAGWQVNAGTVTLADASKAETTFVMPSENVEITATYRQNTPSGGGGGFVPSKPAVPEYVNPFTDVKEGDYFFDAVKWAVENDVTTGTTDTTFSPDMICTRAQAVTFLYRAAGSPAVKGKEMPFADVADDAYFYNAVLWAMENGITKGISETEFAPDMICTREQIVTFLYRTAISMDKDVSVGEETNILSYDDAFDIGEWAIPAVQWAVGDGVMTGTSESTLAPQMECTRAQIVTFLFRAFEE